MCVQAKHPAPSTHQLSEREWFGPACNHDVFSSRRAKHVKHTACLVQPNIVMQQRRHLSCRTVPHIALCMPCRNVPRFAVLCCAVLDHCLPQVVAAQGGQFTSVYDSRVVYQLRERTLARSGCSNSSASWPPLWSCLYAYPSEHQVQRSSSKSSQ